MKKFILATLAFSSVSSFADCSLMVRFVEDGTIQAINSELRNTSIVRYAQYSSQNADLGVKQIKSSDTTGAYNPFGVPVYENKKGFGIYRDGKLIAQTRLSSSSQVVDQELIYELKKLGCN